jgi:3-isopropylmalate/(R)-2-methylmalate dehydratase small subunit
MQKLNIITSIIAGLPLINIDTDMIIPKQFLKTIKRTGLGKNLFHEMRYDLNNQLVPDFILNQKPYQNTQILASLDNFGCGSSREHAPWSLLDFGIRVIIAPSFADIFYNNCFKNGILPLVLNRDEVEEILAYSKNPNNSATVILNQQQVVANNKIYHFEIDSFKKHCLIEGLDDIGLTLEKTDRILNFENHNRQVTGWLYN